MIAVVENRPIKVGDRVRFVRGPGYLHGDVVRVRLATLFVLAGGRVYVESSHNCLWSSHYDNE